MKQSLIRAGTRALAIAIWLGVAALAGEVAARVDDRVFSGQPTLESPTFLGLFYTLDDSIRRGRPGARWSEVSLNNLGLRGPDLLHPRRRECDRWLFLGASETFGEPGIPSGDFPSAARKAIEASIPSDKCVEVANASSPGMSVRQIIAQYEAYLHALDATTVVLYPPTQIYLRDLEPRRRPSETSRRRPLEAPPPAGARASIRSVGDLLDRSRLVGRLKQSAEIPVAVQSWRRERWIASALARHSADWPYRAAPFAQLDSLEADLTLLVEMIRATGARPVLMTHAIRASELPTPEDQIDLVDMRVYFPRATPNVIAAHEYAAARRIRALAAALDVTLIDVASKMSGHRELFIDLVHFSPAGNDSVAKVILESLLPTAFTDTARAVQ